jgi:hypothetical protein
MSNSHKMYQRPLNKQTFSIPWPSKIYPICIIKYTIWQPCYHIIPRSQFLMSTQNCENAFKKVSKKPLLWPRGMGQWTSHPPQEQMTRVRIPPGHKVF